MVTKSQGRRAFAVVRQSSYDDGSLSLDEQVEKVEAWCEREGVQLVATLREQDVSGQRALDKRPGLREAVAAVESGAADLIVVAYFDRLVRSMRTQAEVIERVEKALKVRKQKGSGVVALDVGDITHDTAAQWLTSTFLGLVAEYLARSTGERVHASKVRAIREGRPPFKVLPGLRKRDDGTIEPDPDAAPHVLHAFEMRAASPPATLDAIAEYLRENGIDVATASVERMLRSKQYLGELHYGELQNLEAWDAIIPTRLHDRVQSVRAPRGRHAKSERLLARLGILRCGTCHARMSAGYVLSQGKRHDVYRCQAPRRDCSMRVSIMAHAADDLVLTETERLLRDVHGHAAVHAELDALQLAADDAQDALSRAVSAFDGLGDEQSVRDKLRDLKASRDAAVHAFENLRATVLPLETFRAEDLRGSEVAKQRRAIRLALDRVTVRPGHGAGRLAFSERGSDAIA